MKCRRCLILLGAYDKKSILSKLPIELVRFILSFISKKKKYIKELDKIRGKQGYYEKKINSAEMIKQEKIYKNMNMKYIKTIELVPNGDFNFGRSIINLDLSVDESQRYALKNLRYKNKDIDWDKVLLSIEVDIDGNRFDIIYTKFFKVLRHIYKIKTNLIPFSFSKDEYYLIYSKRIQIRFYLELEINEEIRKVDLKDFRMEIDLYKIENNLRSLEVSIPRLMYCYEGKIKYYSKKYHLQYDKYLSKVTHILIKIKKEIIKRLILCIDDNQDNFIEIDLDELSCYDGTLIIYLFNKKKYGEVTYDVLKQGKLDFYLKIIFKEGYKGSKISIYTIINQIITLGDKYVIPCG